MIFDAQSNALALDKNVGQGRHALWIVRADAQGAAP